MQNIYRDLNHIQDQTLRRTDGRQNIFNLSIGEEAAKGNTSTEENMPHNRQLYYKKFWPIWMLAMKEFTKSRPNSSIFNNNLKFRDINNIMSL